MPDSEPYESGLKPGWVAECNAEVLEWAKDPTGSKAKQRLAVYEVALKGVWAALAAISTDSDTKLWEGAVKARLLALTALAWQPEGEAK